MITSDLFFVFKWWFVFFLIGISFLPITTKIFSGFIDKGYIFSKILGLLFISYAIYLLGSLNILSFSFTNIIIVWIMIALPQIFLLRNNKLINFQNLKLIIIEEILFFVALLLWSYIRGFNPDIRDLEKFMDFGFINSILRTDYFPATDMWFTPLSINYYYFGHLFTAVVTKISQIPSFITFNLMLATIFAFTFTMSFSIGINLINKIKAFSLIKSVLLGLFFAYVVSLAGNLQTIYAFFTKYDSEWPKPFWELGLSISTFPNSYWYPSATRFIYHTIHEFPSYSFVVADLHGHVLDIPIVLTLIAIFLVYFISRKINFILIVLNGFLLAIAYMTNAWDGLIYLGLSSMLLLIILFHNSKGELKQKIIETTKRFIKSIIILLISFFSFSFVFNKDFEPFASGIGLNCAPKFLIDIGNIGPFIFENGFCQITPPWQLLILYGFFIFMIISLIIFLLKRKILVTDIFVITISLFSLILIITPEIIYLKDIYTGHFRANTMFKLSYQAFIMLSISSVYGLIRILMEFKNVKRESALNRVFYLIFLIVGLPLLVLILIYPYFSVPSGYRNLQNRESLNGIKYLENLYPGDYKAINWINENIKGQPVILEAQGDSYSDFARVSAHTGLPTILGWTVHEWLWRGSYDIPSARFPDISTLYETSDIDEAREIIQKYDIDFIYIGKLEQDKYNISEDKFSKLGNIVFRSNDTRIYIIN
jgi:uncharacterized membrane protein